MNEKNASPAELREKELTDDIPNNDGKSGQKETRTKRPFFKNPRVMGLIIFITLVLVIGAVLLWLHSRKYVATDDAFVDTASQQVSSRVGGRILRIFVDDNQDVTAGTVVAELDPADFQTAVDQATATLAQARAQASEAVAQKSVYGAQVDQAEANLGIAQANAENARSQLNRLRGLREASAGAVSQEQWENAFAADKTTSAQVEAAERAVSAVQAQVHYAESLEGAAVAGIRAAESRVQQAQLSLGYTKVVAAIDGRVARKQIAVGNDIQPGTPLMAIVPREVYITANFKETQLQKMEPNQAVEVTVDAFPTLKLRGHVQSFQSGTGQAFSALPAENATGNWVKVVQRIPVKIELDQIPENAARRLGPGMSAEVKVIVAR